MAFGFIMRASPDRLQFSLVIRVYRFQGEAQVGDETLDWSLILKVTGPATGSQELTPPSKLDG
jgi:hypothetical protein